MIKFCLAKVECQLYIILFYNCYNILTAFFPLDNRTEPNLDDLALTFKDFGIVLQEIEEYVNNVEPVPFVHKISAFPVKHPSNLHHPKPESREIHSRPEHIPEYLPLMRPDLEGNFT